MNYVQIWSVYYILHILYDRLYEFSSNYSTLKHSKNCLQLACHTHREALLQHSMKHHLLLQCTGLISLYKSSVYSVEIATEGNYSEAKVQNVSHKVYYNCKQSCLKRKVLFEAI